MRFSRFIYLPALLATSFSTASPTPTAATLEARALWEAMGHNDAEFVYGMDTYKRNYGKNVDVSADEYRQAVAWVKDTLFPNMDTTAIEYNYRQHHNNINRMPAKDEARQAYNMLGLASPY
ncbi:hypothetical protein BKA67DRAFT_541605 [Truncatella angustata]|uniref:Uncharacterized protein n=1 Tax=Truncatella angustata TaxID=152316 RepID=A0A9P8UB07_9PEZI|nr:uncharacterized protein BKA67DRAFT_541605 [Truncatella angustata]KAH6645377.1 hypothetical protein BKA67DRAFT_541605 [Truncatella angustata]KAH8193618.1 hypothetical protein TruAng_012215 [Truncatella angustata]